MAVNSKQFANEDGMDSANYEVEASESGSASTKKLAVLKKVPRKRFTKSGITLISRRWNSPWILKNKYPELLVFVDRYVPYVNVKGELVYNCPRCGLGYDGSMMIACDVCDAWYHVTCVGVDTPSACDDWYCPFCIEKCDVLLKDQINFEEGNFS